MAIQPADPGARRKAILLIITALLFGVVAISAFKLFRRDILAWLERNVGLLQEHPEIILVVTLVMVLPVLVFSLYLVLYGARIVGAQRIPPPGFAVIRDTEIIEGRRAVVRARLIQGISLLLFCLASALPILIWYVFNSLVGGA